MASPDDLPSRRETALAYATTCLASLAWIACVVPGAILVDGSLSSDLATPMARGALLLLPALLLLVTGPIAVLLAGTPATFRSLLAAGDAFVTLFAAGILLHARQGDVPRLVAGLSLFVLFGVAVRDAIRPRMSAPPAPGVPGGGSLRLGLACLALLMPASVLAVGPSERASLLAPFAYVAISAGGARLARSLRGLRLTAVLLLFGVAIHFGIAIRFAMERGTPPMSTWTVGGIGALAFAAVTGTVVAAWGLLLVPRRRAPLAESAA